MLGSTAQKVATNVVFNKKLRIKHMDWSSSNKEAHLYDYVKDFTAKDVCDRIEDLKTEDKKLVFNLGSCSGLVNKNINPDRVSALIQGDISPQSLRRCKRLDSMLPLKFPVHYVLCDEERIPLRPNFVDLVVSCLDIHWVNDLLGCFKQVNSILSDNSPFIGAVLGGDSLGELRSSLQLAEMERLSGVSGHIAPKTTGQDIGRLLQGSGFKLITVDITEIKIRYPSMFELMFDLQGMGENNSSLSGSRHMHRDVLKSAAAIYQQFYGTENPEEGVPATYQIIHFIGWKNPVKATPLRSQ